MNRKQGYWHNLRMTQPKLYKTLSEEYRRNNVGKIRQRTADWKKANRERYNLQQRELYAKNKKKNP